MQLMLAVILDYCDILKGCVDTVIEFPTKMFLENVFLLPPDIFWERQINQAVPLTTSMGLTD